MKIAIADNNNKKFIQDLIDHWEQKGHEIKFETGASEYLAQWADIYFVDTFDNNLHYLFKLYHGDTTVSRTNPWDNNKKPKIVVRALDWEVWCGQARDQKIIDWVDKVICIAPHIEKELREFGDFGDKLKLIRPGVNLEKFTLKTKKTDGFQLGMNLSDMWKYKNHMGGLDIFTTLYREDSRWRLHIRGQHENQTYDPINLQYYLQSRGIDGVVLLYDYLEDINFFYENIDILLHPGQKEGFVYCIAESLCKDIKVVANDFYGSSDIWPKELIYQTHNEAIKMLNEPRQEKGYYRELVKNRYPLEKMLNEMDEYIGT